MEVQVSNTIVRASFTYEKEGLSFLGYVELNSKKEVVKFDCDIKRGEQNVGRIDANKNAPTPMAGTQSNDGKLRYTIYSVYPEDISKIGAAIPVIESSVIADLEAKNNTSNEESSSN